MMDPKEWLPSAVLRAKAKELSAGGAITHTQLLAAFPHRRDLRRYVRALEDQLKIFKRYDGPLFEGPIAYGSRRLHRNRDFIVHEDHLGSHVKWYVLRWPLFRKPSREDLTAEGIEAMRLYYSRIRASLKDGLVVALEFEAPTRKLFTGHWVIRDASWSGTASKDDARKWALGFLGTEDLYPEGTSISTKGRWEF